MEAHTSEPNVVPYTQSNFPPLRSWFSGRVNGWHHSPGSTSFVFIFIQGMGQNTDRDVPFEFEKRHRNFEILQIIRLDLSQEKNGNYCVYEVLISAICDLTISLKQIQLFTRHVSK
jgi:hypothetical protein